jgi:spore coat protein H
VLRRTLTCAAILVALMVEAGPAAENVDGFFVFDGLHTFHLTVAAPDFQRMSPPAGQEGVYTEVPATLSVDDREWGAVSVRYKGNSSYRYAPSALKRSLKLDFGSSEPGRTFHGVSELNLNNNSFDPSQMREALAYDVFRRAGQPAPRTTFARVFITVPGRYARQYAGLYTAVEQVDQAFFQRLWQRPVGLLLKPEGLAGMPYLGDDWTRYEQPYGSRTAPTSGDAARFIALVKLLNQAPDAEFARRVGEYLDVDAFLQFLACEVVLVNTDSPLTTRRNYWIAMHPATQKIVWIPWDMNMAFAGYKPSDAQFSVRQPTAAGVFPLAERMLRVPEFSSRYNAAIRDLVTTNFTVARISRQIATLDAAIRQAAAEDTRITSKAPPLHEFVAERVQAITEQLAGKRRGTPAVAPGPAIVE